MSLSRSRPKSHVHRGYLGPIPPEVWDVVRQAWEVGIFVSSDGARSLAPYVALAASMGWISNVALDGLSFTRVWNVTAEGVAAITQRENYPTC